MTTFLVFQKNLGAMDNFPFLTILQMLFLQKAAILD